MKLPARNAGNQTRKPAFAAGRYFKYAIGEIVLVVIGILIALQINNWNQIRIEKEQEKEILQSLQLDFRADINEINNQLVYKKEMIVGFINCLEILTNDKKATKEEFMDSFRTILQVGGVTLNATTFNNLQTTGEIRLIRNKKLSEKIVTYYNTDYVGWETAFRDYARNTLAPYLMSFDYVPQTRLANMKIDNYKIRSQVNSNELPERKLKDYKQNVFIINALRQRLFNLEGLQMEYNILLDTAKSLDKDIQNYLDTL
tara:strand:- start:4075 stop:4848 length:774 start_codon:yes stop_codon:yes gene_type:complete